VAKFAHIYRINAKHAIHFYTAFERNRNPFCIATKWGGKLYQANFTIKDGTEVPQVLSVEITPKSANVQPEQTKQFSATVTVVGGAPETVTWSITGNLSTLTAINSNGLLTIGINETAKTITVKATSTFNTAKFDEATVTVGSVGIQTITNDELRITVYPNPTTGELRIECRDALQCVFTNVEIYDIYGKKCHVSRVTRPRSAEAEPQPNNQPSTQSLNISAFPSGVYFLKINTENGTITKKVIKQ